MTRLRQMMLEELQRRNYSEETIRHYIRSVEQYAGVMHFHLVIAFRVIQTPSEHSQAVHGRD